MIHINANVDLNTGELIDTGFLHEQLHELFPEGELRVIFVARDIEIESEAWQEDEDTFIRVVLPYEELQHAENCPQFIVEHLLSELKKQELIESSELEIRLEELIEKLQQEIESAA